MTGSIASFLTRLGAAGNRVRSDPVPAAAHGRGRAGGADYLDVKWRLLWLRKEHPDAEIVTELVQHDPQMAIFKATVTVPTGGKATGYGSETASDFPDFIEKAETKAIGRALNALGYGAQFGDFQRPEDLAPERGPELPSREAAPAARPVALPRRDERPAKLPETKNESAERDTRGRHISGGRRSRAGRLLLERVLALGAGTRAERTEGDRESDRPAGRRALTRRAARSHPGSRFPPLSLA